jgi:hypothetical protein
MAQIVPMSSPLEDDPVTNTAAKIALGFENINVTRESPTKKAILSNVSGYVKCGGITAGAFLFFTLAGRCALISLSCPQLWEHQQAAKVSYCKH